MGPEVIVLLFVGAVLVAARWRRVALLEEFCVGAKEGARAAVQVFPTLLALMTAIAMLQAGGALDGLSRLLQPIVGRLGFPTEALPAALLRPLSGSGSLAVLRDILQRYGADSKVGLVASVLQSSTETTFYTLSLYFGYIGIKKTGVALPAALAGDVTGMLLSALTVHLFF